MTRLRRGPFVYLTLALVCLQLVPTVAARQQAKQWSAPRHGPQRSRLPSIALGHPGDRRQDWRGRLQPQRRPYAAARVGDEAVLRGRGAVPARRRFPLRDASVRPRHRQGRPTQGRSDPGGLRRRDARRPHQRAGQTGLPRQGSHLRERRQHHRLPDRHRPAGRPESAGQTGGGARHQARRGRRAHRRTAVRAQQVQRQRPDYRDAHRRQRQRHRRDRDARRQGRCRRPGAHAAGNGLRAHGRPGADCRRHREQN